MAHIKARSADGVCADESALAVAAVPMDKRQVYDWDTRIHLLARGPGIAKGASFELPATQVDVAPTFLGLAGVQPPPDMDGKSLLPHVSGALFFPKHLRSPCSLFQIIIFISGSRFVNLKTFSVSRLTPNASCRQLLHGGSTDAALAPSTAAHLRALPPRAEYAAAWRKAVLLEYYYNDFVRETLPTYF